MEVYVLTNPELGWDCVMGVYDSYDKAYKRATQGIRENWDEYEDGEMTEDAVKAKWERYYCMHIFCEDVK